MQYNLLFALSDQPITQISKPWLTYSSLTNNPKVIKSQLYREIYFSWKIPKMVLFSLILSKKPLYFTWLNSRSLLILIQGLNPFRNSFQYIYSWKDIYTANYIWLLLGQTQWICEPIQELLNWIQYSNPKARTWIGPNTWREALIRK